MVQKLRDVRAQWFLPEAWLAQVEEERHVLEDVFAPGSAAEILYVEDPAGGLVRRPRARSWTWPRVFPHQTIRDAP